MRWQELVERRIADVTAGITGTYTAARAAWGLLPDEPGVGENDPVASSADELAPAESAAAGINGELIPKAMDLATEQIVADTVAAPNGILRARERMSSWLGALAALLHDLQQESGATDNGDDAFQARLDAWRWDFTSAVAGHKQHVIQWIRIVVIAYLSLLGVTGFMLLQRIFDVGRGTRIAIVVGVVGACALLAIAVWVATGMRVRRLKRQRIELAQEDLSRLANRLLRRGLFRAYSQLFEDLTGLQAVVEDALADLSAWAHAEPDLQSTASEAASAPVRAALIDTEVWDIVRDNVRQKASDGTSGAERFRELWREEGSGVSQWLPEGNRLARRLRGALDERHRPAGQAPALAGIFREYAARSTEYLCPTNRLYADHAELVREVSAGYGVERLLLAKQGQEPTGLPDRTGAEIVESLYLRAKPSAGYEVTYSLSSDALEVEFGVCADGQSSPLRRVFEQRGMPLLTSKDPLTFAVVRTVNRLGPSELILTERCRDEFARLRPGQWEKLSLVPADGSGEAASLYRETDEPATMERQLSLAAGRE